MKYFQRRKKRKLYQQWMERANLPSDAIPPEEVAGYMNPLGDELRPRLNMLYILLGISLVVLFAGLIIFVVYSC